MKLRNWASQRQELHAKLCNCFILVEVICTQFPELIIHTPPISMDYLFGLNNSTWQLYGFNTCTHTSSCTCACRYGTANSPCLHQRNPLSAPQGNHFLCFTVMLVLRFESLFCIYFAPIYIVDLNKNCLPPPPQPPPPPKKSFSLFMVFLNFLWTGETFQYLYWMVHALNPAR